MLQQGLTSLQEDRCTITELDPKLHIKKGEKKNKTVSLGFLHAQGWSDVSYLT